jgi:hypothetical protein
MPSDQIPFHKNNNLSSNSVSIMYVMVPEFEIRQIFQYFQHFCPFPTFVCTAKYDQSNFQYFHYFQYFCPFPTYVCTANYDSC